MNLLKIGQLQYVDTDKIVRVKGDADINTLMVSYLDLDTTYKLDSVEAERIPQLLGIRHEPVSRH